MVAFAIVTTLLLQATTAGFVARRLGLLTIRRRALSVGPAQSQRARRRPAKSRPQMATMMAIATRSPWRQPSRPEVVEVHAEPAGHDSRHEQDGAPGRQLLRDLVLAVGRERETRVRQAREPLVEDLEVVVRADDVVVDVAQLEVERVGVVRRDELVAHEHADQLAQLPRRAAQPEHGVPDLAGPLQALRRVSGVRVQQLAVLVLDLLGQPVGVLLVLVDEAVEERGRRRHRAVLVEIRARTGERRHVVHQVRRAGVRRHQPVVADDHVDLGQLDGLAVIDELEPRQVDDDQQHVAERLGLLALAAAGEVVADHRVPLERARERGELCVVGVLGVDPDDVAGARAVAHRRQLVHGELGERPALRAGLALQQP